jgi:hypothetical protein
MITMAHIKLGKNVEEVKSSVENALRDIPGVKVEAPYNILYIEHPDNIEHEEIKRRLMSCDGIRKDAICRGDSKVHLIISEPSKFDS